MEGANLPPRTEEEFTGQNAPPLGLGRSQRKKKRPLGFISLHVTSIYYI